MNLEDIEGYEQSFAIAVCRAESAHRIALIASGGDADAARTAMGLAFLTHFRGPDADRIAQLERDNARLHGALAELHTIAHASWFGDDGTDSDEEREAIREAKAALRDTTLNQTEADDEALPSNERTRLTSAGYDLDQALSEFLDFTDFEISYDPDGEKWVNMHASNWEALLSDARDARAAWSAVGKPEADGKAPQEWPLDPNRRWWIGEQDGNVFDADDDWSGVAVTIEVKNTDEAKTVADYFLGGDQ